MFSIFEFSKQEFLIIITILAPNWMYYIILITFSTITFSVSPICWLFRSPGHKNLYTQLEYIKFIESYIRKTFPNIFLLLTQYAFLPKYHQTSGDI